MFPPVDPHAIREFLLSAAAAWAAWRLISLGLGQRFRGVLTYVGLFAAIEFAFSILDIRSSLYFLVYFFMRPVLCTCAVVAVRELLAVMFLEYPGIKTVGRWAMYAGILLSAGFSIAITTLIWTVGAAGRKKWALFYLDIGERSIVMTLVVVILVILFVLSRYPLHLGKNTVATCVFFGVFFLCQSAQLFAASIAPDLFNAAADWVADSSMALCLGGWALTLRPEEAPSRQAAFSSPAEDGLLRQLDAFNKVLVRATGR